MSAPAQHANPVRRFVICTDVPQHGAVAGGGRAAVLAHLTMPENTLILLYQRFPAVNDNTRGLIKAMAS